MEKVLPAPIPTHPQGADASTQGAVLLHSSGLLARGLREVEETPHPCTKTEILCRRDKVCRKRWHLLPNQRTVAGEKTGSRHTGPSRSTQNHSALP